MISSEYRFLKYDAGHVLAKAGVRLLNFRDPVNISFNKIHSQY